MSKEMRLFLVEREENLPSASRLDGDRIERNYGVKEKVRFLKGMADSR